MLAVSLCLCPAQVGSHVHGTTPAVCFVVVLSRSTTIERGTLKWRKFFTGATELRIRDISPRSDQD
jgi:hypothetical protein